jgi:CubicO group peptidase (beta-lactamase class C family)
MRGDPLNREEPLHAGLARLVAEFRVPGAIVAYWRDGRLSTAAAGVANLNTRDPMTADTGFLIGSITKVWATTVIMGLVEEGVLELDAPIMHYAPDVQFGADKKVAESLTVRTLLNHSSGVDTGDYFVASRDYPDGVEDYIGPIAEARKLTEPATVCSYHNVGWIVAEVILRRVTGKNFHQLLRERVIDPLGLRRTVLSPAEAILHRTAIGSYPTPNGDHRPTPLFAYPDAWAAAGTTLITTVEDTMRFLRMHLNDGVSIEGRRILAADSATAMRTPTCGDPTEAPSGFGLGWRYTDREGSHVFSHGGGSLGGMTHAMISPAENAAVIAFVNSSRASAIHSAILEMVLPDLPSPLAPPVGDIRHDVDLRPFVGSYQRKTQRIDISIDGNELRIRLARLPQDMPGATVALADIEFRAAPVSRTRLLSLGIEPGEVATELHFSQYESDSFHLVYTGGRLARRIVSTLQ